MTPDIFKTIIENDQNLELTADANRKYVLKFLAAGMEIEFVMLAGQTFKISGMKSDLNIYVYDVEPEIPGGGLQLVPIAQRH